MASLHTTKCAHCGAVFESVRDDARHCSGACRTRAHRARRAERQRKAADLLAQQSAALASGDYQAAETLRREVSRLMQAS